MDKNKLELDSEVYFERKANQNLKEYLKISRLIPHKIRTQIMAEQKWRCHHCGTPIKPSLKHKWKAKVGQIDHIHPFSKRYSYYKGFQYINERDNLQALCGECNRKKSNKLNY